MTDERFYRGGNRSPFRVNFIGGSTTLGTNKSSFNIVVPIISTDSRIKRCQVIVQAKKNAQPRYGWLAFLRVGDSETLDITGLNIDNPAVLRPKVWVTNVDHAIYVDLYLEAINLTSGEKIQVIGFASGSTDITYAAKWYTEESLH